MVDINDLRDCIQVLQSTIDGVRPEQLSQPSPCEGWTVRDVINHVTAGGHMFALSAAGKPLPAMDGPVPDFLGDDPSGAFAQAASAAVAAFDEPGAMDREITLPFGAVPAPAALAIAFGDLLVHTWDIAQGTGNPAAIPAGLIDKAYGFYQQALTDDLRVPGVFGPTVEVAADAPAIDKLVAFAGRQP